MRNNTKLLVVTILVLLFLGFVYVCGAHGFQDSFWPNFWADLIIAIIFGTLISEYTSLTKTPKLRMSIKQEGLCARNIKFSLNENGEYDASFNLAAHNSGNKMLKSQEGYWHIYFSNGVQVQMSGSETYELIDGNHVRNIILLPIYPNSFLDIGPQFKIRVKSLENFSVHYFFSTEYGYFPGTVRMNQETARVEYETMGKIIGEVYMVQLNC